ncbi:hypothetical protein PC122_g24562 [Phytophthora cactorum]|nr:hypothetical protein PC122_g24562 [Phytophthora cactorum]
MIGQLEVSVLSGRLERYRHVPTATQKSRKRLPYFRSWLWRATRFINNPAINTVLLYWTPVFNPLASKSNGGASVVQLSPFLGSIGGYTKDTADFRKQAGPRLLVLQYRAQHDHSIACVLPAV